MEKEKLEGLLIDMIDGNLDPATQREVEGILSTDAEARLMFEQLKQVTRAMSSASQLEPPRGMRDTFLKMLDDESKQSGGKQVFMQPTMLRVAAAVVLVLSGVAIGYWVNMNQQQENEMALLRREMEATKQMMLAMMENPQSASRRIQGVNVALTIVNADDEVVTALVKTMNGDVNTNVRLAALDALSRLSEDPVVRLALIRSLDTQQDPVVQIALIQLLVKMKEKGVVNELERIINDSTTIKPVKDEAYTGIMKLS
jgi:hypothetical protein